MTTNNDRTSNFKKNAILLLFCQVGSIGLSFILVPLTLKYLGVSEYGVWITLVGVIEWFNFFDIGLGHGLRNKYAEAKATNNLDDVKKYVSTTFFMMAIISVIIFLIFLFASYFIVWCQVLNSPKELEVVLQTLTIYLVGMFCVRFVMNIISVLLTADQNPAIPAIVLLSGNALSLISVYLLTLRGGTSLFAMGICLYISQILPLIIAFVYFFSTKYKTIFPSWKSFSKSHIKQVLSLGIKFFLIQITALLLLQSNNIIIAHVCGLSEVTDFNIAFKYVNILFTVFMTFLTPLWSASTEAYARNDIDWIKKSYNRLNNFWMILIFVGIIMVVISPVFYNLWLKNKILPNIPLLSLLLLNVLFLMRSTLYRSFMNGVGKIKMQFVITLMQSVIHIPLAIILGKQFGVLGVVFTMMIWNLINSIWEPIQFKRIISNTAKGIWVK
ncbi:lipopolysaccharide biosynthesis protein [Flavobacterium psychrophilum]|uniref:lipopolysaccharide biosynthesis protein n=1 Tax=Flavobacterium psychrophilum TaxID=96345 RepID=UPI000B7C11C4|nr:oligosaccharide flippase family protein [Flavobacterium psychrophilum]SNB09022.1 Probable transmembrane protein. O-Ag polymerase / Lipid A core - O-antigen ligase / O-Ag chain-length regulator family protein [Flavobacterium psychrophilum]